MQPDKLWAMISFLQIKASGGLVDADTLAAVRQQSAQSADRSQRVSRSSGGAIAVLPLFGMIMQRGNMMGDISGPRGTSLERFTQQFRAAMNDPSVSTVVLDIDSPGGTVTGVPELAAEILDARAGGGKRIVAVSDCLCASAAYYIASACSEVVVSPSSLTGSIGVYMVHEDLSKALEKQGVSATLVYHGANKVNGNHLGPLTDGARQEMQDRVNYYGNMFENAVAKGRKMTQTDVRGKLGEGKVFNAQKAKSSGMADSIGTLDEVLARFGVARQPGSPARASPNGFATSQAIDAAHLKRERELQGLHSAGNPSPDLIVASSAAARRQREIDLVLLS